MFARTILDETLDVYFSQFSQKYVNVSPANNTIQNLNSGNYDYIEIMEVIDKSIDDTLSTLYQRIDQNNYYRSTTTGASFSDIANEFNYLKQVKVSSLFSEIYKYQITKNKSILISDYTTRIDNNDIANAKEDSIVEDVVMVIDAYVKKMRESGNTNISYEYILDNLHERNLEEYFSDQTVTYDELIYSWKDHNENKQHSIIDSAYCKYVIDTFTKCSGECGGQCQNSSLTCTAIHNADYKKMQENIETEISDLIEDLDALYTKTTKTNDEYNEFLGASYISVLSSASVKESVNVTLYTLIAFFFLMFVCCGGSIVLGRLGDIINYIFYTDHLTGYNNRAYFDKYLKSKDKKHLDVGNVYCTVDISNLIHINGEYSRTVGDEIIKLFATNIKEVFGKTKAQYIYNGNGSFVILIEDSDQITVEDIMNLFKLNLDEREEHKEIVLEYKIGVAEITNEINTARKLLSAAIKDKETFISDVR